MEAAVVHDYHDAAHFSRNFKRFFGVAASIGYGRS